MALGALVPMAAAQQDAASAPAAAPAAEASAPAAPVSLVHELLRQAPCLISVAQGRNFQRGDADFNDFWNRINAGIQQFVDQELRKHQLKVFSGFQRVEAAGSNTKSTAVARLARAQPCTWLLQISAWSEQEHELTVELSLNRLARLRDDAVTVGDEVYTFLKKYDTTGNFGETYVFSDAAAGYVRDLLAARAAP